MTSTSDLLIHQYDLLETEYSFVMDIDRNIVWKTDGMLELPFIKNDKLTIASKEDELLWSYFLKQLLQQQTGDLLLPWQSRCKQVVFHIKGFFQQQQQFFVFIFQIVNESNVEIQQDSPLFLNYFRQGIILTTLNHSIVHFNKYIEKMIPKQFMACCVNMHHLFEQHIIVVKDYERLLKSVENKTSYTGSCTIEGVEMRLSILFDEEAQQYIYMFEDITELIELKKQLNNREYLSEIGEMAATLVHEMRNPMTCIKGYVDMMLLDNSPNYNYMPIIERELTHLNQLCGDILFLSKPIQRDAVGVDLLQLVKEVKELMEGELQGGNIALKLTYYPHSRFIVSGHEMYFKQIVMNIIKNAIQSIEEEGIVEVTLYEKVHSVQLIVKDTGCGIAEQALENIFDMFYTTKSYGTGLGLPLVKKIVNQLNGTIDIKSTVGIGTKITIEFPTIH